VNGENIAKGSRNKGPSIIQDVENTKKAWRENIEKKFDGPTDEANDEK